jgi:hypothetical protein
VRVIVVDAAQTILATNTTADSFFYAAVVVGENAARRQLLGPFWAEREEDDERQHERDLAGDLHANLARHPSDPALTAIVSGLHARAPQFESLWPGRPAEFTPTARKTFHHPTAGRITMDCYELEKPGSDVRFVIWTAASDSADAQALRAPSAH